MRGSSVPQIIGLATMKASPSCELVMACREPPFGSDQGTKAPHGGQPQEKTRGETMKYMLMMNHPGKGPYEIASWPKADLSRHIQFMMSFARKLGASGELVAAEGLSGPDQARRVRAGHDG